MPKLVALFPRVRSFALTCTLAALVVVASTATAALAATLPRVGVDPRLLEQYRQQADRGDAQAQLSLGYLHAQGLGVAKDLTLAVEWYRKAALQGHGQAQMALGRAYQDGLGVPADPSEAARWYQLVVNQGYTDANARLGALYEGGRGVDKDPQRAASLFRAAAADGDMRAQTALGAMLYEGRGIAADQVQGRALIEQAAANGLDAARKVLIGYGLAVPAAQARSGEAVQPTLGSRPSRVSQPNSQPNQLSAEDEEVASRAPKVFGIAFDAKLMLRRCEDNPESTQFTCFTPYTGYESQFAPDRIKWVRVYFSPYRKPGWILYRQGSGHLMLTLIDGLVNRAVWETGSTDPDDLGYYHAEAATNLSAQRMALTERFGEPRRRVVTNRISELDGEEHQNRGLLWSGEGLVAGEGWIESESYDARIRALANRAIERKVNQGGKL